MEKKNGPWQLHESFMPNNTILIVQQGLLNITKNLRDQAAYFIVWYWFAEWDVKDWFR